MTHTVHSMFVDIHVQGKEGSGCSLGDSMIVCQSLSLVQTGSAPTVSETATNSDQRSAADETEPMRISLDFAKTDDDGNEASMQEELNSDFDSLVITGSQPAPTSSS